MGWIVESYCEIVQGNLVEIAENEAISMLKDPAACMGVVRLLAWLRGLPRGRGDPMFEPYIKADDRYLRYRCEGASVVIFHADPDRRGVDVLRFAPSASTYPFASDLSLSERRLLSWRG